MNVRHGHLQEHCQSHKLFLLLGRGSDSKKSFVYGILYKLKVRSLMFLSTVKTGGLTAKISLRPSHHRLYFKCVIKKSSPCVIRMTGCPLLVRVLENKAYLSFSCSLTKSSSLVDPAARSLAV